MVRIKIEQVQFEQVNGVKSPSFLTSADVILYLSVVYMSHVSCRRVMSPIVMLYIMILTSHDVILCLECKVYLLKFKGYKERERVLDVKLSATG